MNTYLIAASPQAMARNEGTEIIASGIVEALDKYEALGGACVPDVEGNGAVWVRKPDGSESKGFIEYFYPIQLMEDELEPLGVLL